MMAPWASTSELQKIASTLASVASTSSSPARPLPRVLGDSTTQAGTFRTPELAQPGFEAGAAQARRGGRRP